MSTPIRDRFKLTRDRLTRAGLVVALLAGVLIATFGAGYRSSQAARGNASAYLQKGRTVVRVNAASGATDAKAAHDLAPRRRRLEVVQVAPDRVYVVNNDTDETWLLPTDTMRPVPVDVLPGTPSPVPGTGDSASPAAGAGPATSAKTGADQSGPDTGRRHLVAGGGTAYLLDTKEHTIALLVGPHARPVDLHRVDDVVVDGSGTAWALSRAEGKLYTVVNGDVQADHTVCIPNEPVYLTLAGDRPVVYIPERGIVRMFGRDVAHPETPVANQPGDGVRVAAPGADVPVLVNVVPRTDTVVKVDFRTGKESQITLQGREGPRSFGRPVVAGDRVYVPDYTKREVVILQLEPLRQLKSVSVPGTDSSFDVTAHDGRVWIHNPYSRTVLSFDRDGQVDSADLGPGDGVDDPDPATPRPTSTPTAPAPTAKPTRRAPTGPTTPQSRTAPPPPRVDVPAVKGMTQTEACGTPGGTITRAGLRCAPPASRQDPGCETGKAVDSTPAAGARVAPNTVVTVFYCGPTTVPGPLTGPVDQACQTVEAANLVCARRAGGLATTPAEMGKVIDQDPAAGTTVPTRSTVTVTYLRTDAVEVPNVVGLDRSQACPALQVRGFTCTENDMPYWDTVVHQQQPAPGSAAPPNSAVQYDLAFTMPSTLHRYKAPGQEARYLSTGGGPAGWSQQSDIGGVYLNTDTGPDFIDVHQFSCSGSCGSQTVGYFYKSALTSPAPTTPPNSRWRYDGVAFKCLASQHPGTRGLYALFKESLVAWAFAPQDSQEYKDYVNAGYTPQQPGPICYVWFGVPGFRPNG